MILAIDNGTSSTRVIVFNHQQQIVQHHQVPYDSIYQKPGWCEQDPMVIWRSLEECLSHINVSDVKAVGITNQRETLCCWDKQGSPICNAIVWLDTRTEQIVKRLKPSYSHQKLTGLPISTYFSAVKLKWLLENDPKVKTHLDNQDLLVGTVDSWLIYKLTGKHLTDVTNASRTMLMDIHKLQWSPEMLKYFDFPISILPEIKSSSEVYGSVETGPLKGIRITGCLGDQHAALLGQRCTNPGDAKNTYGTGCFMLMNTGMKPAVSKHGLLTTVAFKIDDRVYYALEGSIAIAGAAVQWLRDSIQLVKSAEELSQLAGQVDSTQGVVFVPALTGLFAPHWRSEARGTITGLSQYSNKKHICRALLEAVSLQTLEILEAMQLDSGVELQSLKVDGGMSNSDSLLQIQADTIGINVVRPQMRESTAMGAAYAAGLAIKFWSMSDLLSDSASSDVFESTSTKDQRQKKLGEWVEAVKKA